LTVAGLIRDGDRVFPGVRDSDGEGTLMVEVDVEGGGSAGIPRGLGDRKVKEDHALSGLVGIDEGFAEEGIGGEFLERGEGGVEVGKIRLLDGVGGELFAIGGGEGGGEVLEEEGEVETVLNAEGGEDVEVVLVAIAIDEDRVGGEDGVGGIDSGVGDGEISCLVGGVAEEKGDDDAENNECDEDRRQEVAAVGLGEGRFWHWLY
jgi:hypothetical protein